MYRTAGIFLLVAVLITGVGHSRNLYQRSVPTGKANIYTLPYATVGVHNIGKIAMTISNLGLIGNGDTFFIDPLTGERAPALNYPQGYQPVYLGQMALWVGAIKGFDTVVTTANGLGYSEIHEFWPDIYPEGDIKYRSNKDPEAPEYDSSISNQDFIAEYYDTLTNTSFTGFDYITGESHSPINIKVTQSSYAWGYDYAEDFIIIDYQILYRGSRDLDNIYFGIYVNPSIGKDENYNNRSNDDICGFVKSVPSKYVPDLIDTINVVYAADNDADPNSGGSLQGPNSPTSAMGIKVLRTPSDVPNFSFNWWVQSFYSDGDWGPRKQTGDETLVREFHGGGLGTPYSDNDKFYMMSQHEFDYDQVTTSYNHSNQGWLGPPSNAYQVANGTNIQYLVSAGPFSAKQGDILPFTIAVVMGADFYSQQGVWMGYSKFRDFEDLGLNAVWASWVYDNPGVDTDGDGYKGKYYIEVFDSAYVEVSGGGESADSQWVATYAETTYYTGDGAPDFEGANPPPLPKVTLHPRVNQYNVGEIEVLWNGRVAETSEDQFSQEVDFEGYRVYYGLSDREDDFIMLSSYDLPNYNRYEYNRYRDEWEIVQQPFELRELRDMYGDDFDPFAYYDEENNFKVYEPSVGLEMAYYFEPHDWNQSDLTDTLGIHKLYPDQPYPSTTDLDSARIFYPEELTPEGKLKYFEYRYIIRDLLPSQRYFVSVTTFDHGYPQRELAPQEASASMNAVEAFAQNSTDLVISKGLNVVVYPNPYRIDGNYQDRFEGWDTPDLPGEYNRAINFTNLPPKCTIRIFTLDGDLVREIEHDKPANDPTAMHEKWDVINRNTMITVSGIYYWVVDSPYGKQIGKLVIIR